MTVKGSPVAECTLHRVQDQWRGCHGKERPAPMSGARDQLMLPRREGQLHAHWCEACSPVDPSSMSPGWDDYQDLGETVAEMSQCLIDKDGQLEGVTPRGGTLPKTEGHHPDRGTASQ